MKPVTKPVTKPLLRSVLARFGLPPFMGIQPPSLRMGMMLLPVW